MDSTGALPSLDFIFRAFKGLMEQYELGNLNGGEVVTRYLKDVRHEEIIEGSISRI